MSSRNSSRMIGFFSAGRKAPRPSRLSRRHYPAMASVLAMLGRSEGKDLAQRYWQISWRSRPRGYC